MRSEHSFTDPSLETPGKVCKVGTTGQAAQCCNRQQEFIVSTVYSCLDYILVSKEVLNIAVNS